MENGDDCVIRNRSEGDSDAGGISAIRGDEDDDDVLVGVRSVSIIASRIAQGSLETRKRVSRDDVLITLITTAKGRTYLSMQIRGACGARIKAYPWPFRVARSASRAADRFYTHCRKISVNAKYY